MWGVTGAAYLRISEPQYEDGIGTPRTMNIDGKELPDAITVSTHLLPQVRSHETHPHLTAIAVTWSQFVAHDISYTLPLSGYEQVGE